MHLTSTLTNISIPQDILSMNDVCDSCNKSTHVTTVADVFR